MVDDPEQNEKNNKCKYKKQFVCIDDLPHNRTLLQGDVETNVGVDLLRFLGTARISRKTLEI